jgi:hypothetical protein
MKLSEIIGTLVGLGLLIYYGYVTTWYWPIALFLVGSILSGLMFGILDMVFGTLLMGFGSFVGWPVAAAAMYVIINGM